MDPRIIETSVERAGRLASMLGRAFADDPMILWKLRPGVAAPEIACTFEGLLTAHASVGTLREIDGGVAAAGWIPPAYADRFDEVAQAGREGVVALSDDDGARFDAFWTWVGERVPRDTWYLDFVGVDPAQQGLGYGTALIRDGIERAEAAGTGASLITETPTNVGLYQHLGFRIVEHADAVGNGPHIWVMRRDPVGR